MEVSIFTIFKGSETCLIGWGFVLRHYSTLQDLRFWRDAIERLGFNGQQLMVAEMMDSSPENNKQNSGKQVRGRPKGSGGKGTTANLKSANCKDGLGTRGSGMEEMEVEDLVETMVLLCTVCEVELTKRPELM